MARNLIFLDIETNGRDRDRHDVWELAWWNLTTGSRGHFLPFLRDGVSQFLANAELEALRVNRFIDRWPDLVKELPYGSNETSTALFELQGQIWPDPVTESDPKATRGVMICAQPKFDLPFVSRLFGRYDFDPEPWHHRAIDLASYAAGVIGLDPADPPGAARVAELCGVRPGDHTAEGDVTSGGRSFLLLREAWRQAHRRGVGAVNTREWLDAQPLRGHEIDTLIGAAS